MKSNLKEKITKWLKLTFLIHFFVAILFGIIYMLFPDFFFVLIAWPYKDPVITRILGAAMIGFAMSSLLAWRETDWLKVKIIVQMEMVWLALGTIMLFISAFIYFPSIFIWFVIALFLAFLIAFAFFYYIQEK